MVLHSEGGGVDSAEREGKKDRKKVFEGDISIGTRQGPRFVANGIAGGPTSFYLRKRGLAISFGRGPGYKGSRRDSGKIDLGGGRRIRSCRCAVLLHFERTDPFGRAVSKKGTNRKKRGRRVSLNGQFRSGGFSLGKSAGTPSS